MSNLTKLHQAHPWLKTQQRNNLHLCPQKLRPCWADFCDPALQGSNFIYSDNRNHFSKKLVKLKFQRLKELRKALCRFGGFWFFFSFFLLHRNHYWNEETALYGSYHKTLFLNPIHKGKAWSGHSQEDCKKTKEPQDRIVLMQNYTKQTFKKVFYPLVINGGRYRRK